MAGYQRSRMRRSIYLVCLCVLILLQIAGHVLGDVPQTDELDTSLSKHRVIVPKTTGQAEYLTSLGGDKILELSEHFVFRLPKEKIAEVRAKNINVEYDKRRFPLVGRRASSTSALMSKVLDALHHAEAVTAAARSELGIVGTAWGDQPHIKNIFTGAPTPYAQTSIDCKAAPICVIDTGINTQVFSGQIDASKVSTRCSVANGLCSDASATSHGTAVAGILAATNIGVCGTADIIVDKALSDTASNYIYATDIIRGLTSCTAANAKVILIASGGSEQLQIERTAIDAASTSAFVVVSGGNTGTPAFSYPAAYSPGTSSAAMSGPISVAASTFSDTRASISTSGTFIEIAAPGQEIPNIQGSSTGTSYAAALVAGCLSWARAKYPQCDLNSIRTKLREKAYSSSSTVRSELGFGILRCHDLITALGTLPCATSPPPPPPQPQPQPQPPADDCPAPYQCSAFSTCSPANCLQSRSVVCSKEPCPTPIPVSQRSCCTLKYKWTEGVWSPCSATCGNGTSTREVKCVNENNVNVDFPETNCPSPKPADSKPCDSGVCPAWRQDVPWSNCSASCGPGVQKRTLECYVGTLRVTDDKCKNFPAPPVTQACFLEPCYTYAWKFTENWSTCSATCGPGKKTRYAQCIRNDSLVITNGTCPNNGPSPAPEVLDCTIAPCPIYAWVPSVWSPCSASCGKGTHTRTVQCTSNGVPTTNVSLCPGTPPVTTEDCNTEACITYRYEPDPWGSCSVSCGGGRQSRTYKCMSSQNKVVDENMCVNITKPEVTQNCNTQVCPSYQWMLDPWTPCSKSCGGGESKTNVFCLRSDNQKVTDSYCQVNAPKPNSTKACNTAPCPEFRWRGEAWSACSQSCNIGMQNRKLVCHEIHSKTLMNDSLCAGASKPPTQRLCNTQACPSGTFQWVEGEWGLCSTACGKGAQTRINTCRNAKGEVVDKHQCDASVGPEPSVIRECEGKLCKSVGKPADWLAAAHEMCGSQGTFCLADSDCCSKKCKAGKGQKVWQRRCL